MFDLMYDFFHLIIHSKVIYNIILRKVFNALFKPKFLFPNLFVKTKSFFLSLKVRILTQI